MYNMIGLPLTTYVEVICERVHLLSSFEPLKMQFWLKSLDALRDEKMDPFTDQLVILASFELLSFLLFPVDAWKKSKEMGTVMSISFFEDVLKFTSQLAIIDAELVSIAEESFYTIKQARESSPQDLDYMLVCYIKNGNLMR